MRSAALRIPAMIDGLCTRVQEGLGWRLDAARERGGPRYARCESTCRHLFWSLPGVGPKAWSSVHVVRRSALGDVLMCTPALRQLKRINPRVHITFYTRYPAVVQGLSFIDQVCGDVYNCPRQAIELRYEHTLPPPRHLARIMGDRLGLRITDVRPKYSHSAPLAAGLP